MAKLIRVIVQVYKEDDIGLVAHALASERLEREYALHQRLDALYARAKAKAMGRANREQTYGPEGQSPETYNGEGWLNDYRGDT